MQYVLTCHFALLIRATVPILSSDSKYSRWKISQVTGIRRASNPKGVCMYSTPYNKKTMVISVEDGHNKPRRGAPTWGCARARSNQNVGWYKMCEREGAELSKIGKNRKEKKVMYPTHFGTFLRWGTAWVGHSMRQCVSLEITNLQTAHWGVSDFRYKPTLRWRATRARWQDANFPCDDAKCMQERRKKRKKKRKQSNN